jgi:hypothetical protein
LLLVAEVPVNVTPVAEALMSYTNPFQAPQILLIS